MSSRFSVPASKVARDQSSPAISLAFNTVLQRGCHLCEHCGLSAKIDTKVLLLEACCCWNAAAAGVLLL
ncbi:unnamed protein product [Camellia sinensis]